MEGHKLSEGQLGVTVMEVTRLMDVDPNSLIYCSVTLGTIMSHVFKNGVDNKWKMIWSTSKRLALQMHVTCKCNWMAWCGVNLSVGCRGMAVEP